MLHKKTEAWQTSGTWIMVTSCVTQCLYCPTYKRSTSPTQKLAQSELENQRRSPNGLCFHGSSWKRRSRNCRGASCFTDQLLAKASVIRAMHERVQLCQVPQTVFALLSESLGVSRVSHILRVHGHTILNEEEAAQIFEGGRRSLERLFPGFTEDSSEQAALSASQSVIGYKRSADAARPAHLGALVTSLLTGRTS